MKISKISKIFLGFNQKCLELSLNNVRDPRSQDPDFKKLCCIGVPAQAGPWSDVMYCGGVMCEYFAYQDDVGKPNSGKLPILTCYVLFGSSEYKDNIIKQ
jgi:hypothetical protein